MLLKNMFKFFNLFFSYTNSIDLFIIFSFFIIWLFPLFFSIINKNNLKKVILIFNVFLKKLLVICISFIFYDYFFYCFDLEPSLYFLFELFKNISENEVNEDINKKKVNEALKEIDFISKKKSSICNFFLKNKYSLILYFLSFTVIRLFFSCIDFILYYNGFYNQFFHKGPLAEGYGYDEVYDINIMFLFLFIPFLVVFVTYYFYKDDEDFLYFDFDKESE